MSDAEPDPTRVERVVDADGDATSVFARPGVGGPPSGGPPRSPAGPPRGPSPDRRRWVLAGLLGLIVVVLGLILVVQRDDGPNATGTSTTLGSGSTSSSSATASTAPDDTRAPVVTQPLEECAGAGVDFDEPGVAAATAYDAWVRGDRACAAELMTPAALDALFARDGAGAMDAFLGCTDEDEPDPHADCAFTYDGGSTHYLLNDLGDDGWQIFEVTQTAD